MNALRLRQEISTESIPSLRRRETVDPVWYHTMRITASLPPKEYQQYFPQARKRRATCRYIIKRSLETFWRGVVGILDGVCLLVLCVFLVSFLVCNVWTNRAHRCRPFPPSACLRWHCAEGSAFPTFVGFRRILQTHALALPAHQFFTQEEVPTNTSMNPMKLEATTLTLLGTIFTYY